MSINRREFLVAAGAFGTFGAMRLHGAEPKGAEPVVRFGLVTDVHYADHAPDPQAYGVVGRRYYQESLRKLDAAVAVFNARKVDFAIELGDFKDLSSSKEKTLAHLEAAERSLAAFRGPRYHVLGNHDFDCLSEAEFYARVSNGDGGEPMARGHYAFEKNGLKFIVLDACYDSKLKHYSCNNPWNDANVPPEELKWLEAELASAKGQAVVFCHQRLDPSSEPKHLVRNAAAVRDILKKSGKVKTVFTGHQHLGSFAVWDGIAYYSLVALVCDSGERANSFAEAAIYADGTFTVTGWYNALSYNCGKGVC